MIEDFVASVAPYLREAHLLPCATPSGRTLSILRSASYCSSSDTALGSRIMGASTQWSSHQSYFQSRQDSTHVYVVIADHHQSHGDSALLARLL